jgi:hypothetical protein
MAKVGRLGGCGYARGWGHMGIGGVGKVTLSNKNITFSAETLSKL